MSQTADRPWRCSVCGYVHRGPAPPAECPICGASSDAFEPVEDPKWQARPRATNRWRCLNCGYIHEGPAPPAECPVCGAHADRFEPLVKAAERAASGAEPVKVVIVGAGVAGLTAAETIRDAAPSAEITLISKEASLPYYRLNLTRYLAGEVGREGLPIHSQDWYEAKNIRLLRGAEVRAIRLDALAVELCGKETMPFERLVLTIGAHPFMPPFPGAQRAGVTSLRTVDDAERILDGVASGAASVVIGGGVLGLETAGALARRGAPVTLCEGHGWLMPRQLNETAGEILRRHVEGTGINLLTGARTAEIVGDERARGVRLDDGRTLDAEIVIITTGVRTNSYLARTAGLEVNLGVVVDNHLHTSHPNVLAAGDVAEHRGVVYGIWGPSQYQGSIAGLNAVGAEVEFGGIPRSNTLKVLGIDLFSIGSVTAEDGSYQVFEEQADGDYGRFVFRDGHLTGAILVGDATLTPAVKKAVESRADFSGLLARRPSAREVMAYLGGD